MRSKIDAHCVSSKRLNVCRDNWELVLIVGCLFFVRGKVSDMYAAVLVGESYVMLRRSILKWSLNCL